MGGFRGQSEAELTAWLRQMLLNKLTDYQRRYYGAGKRLIKREVPLDAGDSGLDPLPPGRSQSSPSAVAMRREVGDLVETAVATLPEDYQRVLRLRYQEERSFEEIGQMMGRTPNAARKLWLRAIERLQVQLGEP
jgi:RNA polymerase sigma-70 factor (ECF subfamily)